MKNPHELLLACEQRMDELEVDGLLVQFQEELLEKIEEFKEEECTLFK